MRLPTAFVVQWRCGGPNDARVSRESVSENGDGLNFIKMIWCGTKQTLRWWSVFKYAPGKMSRFGESSN